MSCVTQETGSLGTVREDSLAGLVVAGNLSLITMLKPKARYSPISTDVMSIFMGTNMAIETQLEGYSIVPGPRGSA